MTSLNPRLSMLSCSIKPLPRKEQNTVSLVKRDGNQGGNRYVLVHTTLQIRLGKVSTFAIVVAVVLDAVHVLLHDCFAFTLVIQWEGTPFGW